ncbi:hypothetical protein B0T18DRAFT_368880 [Schizothecium vesticola]|uniref:Uncharacterized protein n=1 Tax=Schizothecium vesticola TaxID=314040 RepID=A0AA40EVV4_9PEZI|nr:hypothetical protein B0T18DRAFT_368880 [Schizothecium vesticola]
MISRPILLSPALPAHLIQHMIQHCTHPSTLVVCSTRDDFLSVVAQHIIDEQQHHHQEDASPSPPPTTAAAHLLAAPLFQVAVARHIRVVFAPTVSHLRAHLSVFCLDDSSVPAPPTTAAAHGSSSSAPPTPTLLIYGLLALHRETSEWSVQGLGGTAAVLVEAAARVGMRAVVVEPRAYGEEVELGQLLGDEVPILSGVARRTGLALRGSGWAGRTVEVKRVLARWFDFREGNWDGEGEGEVM